MADLSDDDITVTILTTSSAREELIEALMIVGRDAHREQHIVGTEAYPTRWDNLHGLIDSFLDELAGR